MPLPVMNQTLPMIFPLRGQALRSGLVLFVADLLQPVDRLALKRFLDGGVRHGGRRGSAVPVFFTRRKPDYIARTDFLDRPALALDTPTAGRDDQGLTERMRVPCRARTGLETNAGTNNACRVGRLEQRIDPDRTGEIIRRSLAGRLRIAAGG
jgi:hypothetical protein